MNSRLQGEVLRHRENLKRDSRVINLEKRLVWDWLYSVVTPKWISDNIYPYANDSHLQTAIKKIAAEIAYY